MIKNLTLTYNPNPSSLVPKDGYWLNIEQVKEDEKATIGFVADTIDALFDTSLCVEVDEEEPEETSTVEPSQFTSMEEVLAKIDQKSEVDMSACEMLRMGTYQAQLKIVRSHPEIPYTLKLSVGEILETVLVEEPISRNINVVSASSVVLPFPVQSGLRCSWIGSVIGKSGFVSPPAIQAIGNTLFWNESVTGVIRAEYNTIYDLVTVEIPGVPNYVGADLGKPQDSNALAFYHYLVYRTTIIPVDEEEGLLEEVCGYSSSTGIYLDSDEPLPDPPPIDEEQYGCIDYFPLNHPIFGSEYYTEKCCVDGPQHDGCNVRKTKKEGGKGLSQEIINRMTNEWPGPIEFIGLGPITPEGCGANYETTQIVSKNCCDEVEPMYWDSGTSVEVLAPGTRGIVGVIGGSPPYYWSIRGIGFAFSADGTLRDGITDTPYVWVYALPIACGPAPIEVTDGCSLVISFVRSTIFSMTLKKEIHTFDNDIVSLLPSEHVTNGFYGGYPEGNELCRFSADGRFIATKEYLAYLVMTTLGEPIGYAAAYGTYGMPAPACLNGIVFTDPLSGMSFTWFINCMPYNPLYPDPSGWLNMSHNLNYVYIWQVTC